MAYFETYLRVVPANVYFEGSRGLVIEAVAWDREDCISSERHECGDFQIGASRYSRGFPGFFKLKNAIAYCRKEFGVEPSVKLEGF